jgi:hypothetical protein
MVGVNIPVGSLVKQLREDWGLTHWPEMYGYIIKENNPYSDEVEVYDIPTVESTSKFNTVVGMNTDNVRKIARTDLFPMFAQRGDRVMYENQMQEIVGLVFVIHKDRYTDPSIKTLDYTRCMYLVKDSKGAFGYVPAIDLEENGMLL